MGARGRGVRQGQGAGLGGGRGRVGVEGGESGQLVLGAISWKVGEGLGTPHRLVPLFLGSSCSFRHHSIRELLLLLGRQG